MKAVVIKKIRKLLDVPFCKDSNYTREIIPLKLREGVKDYYRQECFLCLTESRRLLVHHIQPDGKTIFKNLVPLCSSCHEFIHIILYRYFRYKKFARRGAWNH